MLNDGQKRALRKHSSAIIHDLELTSTLTAKFLSEGIFNEEQIEQMEAEGPRQKQIQKMLKILHRKPPRAFTKFVHSLQSDYHWLAQDLATTYHNIKHKKDPEMLDLKERVALYVHEEFGNSKRLCEEDKKSIRLFLYRKLCHFHDDDVLLHAGQHRRNSIESTESEKQYMQHRRDLQQEAESDTLQRAYKTLCQLLLDNQPTGQHDETGGEMDTEVTEVTIDMLDTKLNELVTKFQDLKSEITKCHKALGICQQECDRPLHEVLERLMEVREADHDKMIKLQERLTTIDKQRLKLEDTLNRKKHELDELCKDLARAEYSVEKMERINGELQEKVMQLEHTQSKFQTLKTMVKSMNTDVSTNLDCVDGVIPHKSVNLPPLVQNTKHKHGKSAHGNGRGISHKPDIDPYTRPWKC